MPYLVVDSSTLSQASPYGLGISTQNIFQSQFKTLDQTIENLKMLLLTKKGELVGDINFGTDLVYVLFQLDLVHLLSLNGFYHHLMKRYYPFQV